MVNKQPCPQCGLPPEIRITTTGVIVGCWSNAHFEVLVLSDGTNLGLDLWPLTGLASPTQDAAIESWNFWATNAFTNTTVDQSIYDEA